MSHITSNYMAQHGLGPFLPSPGTLMAQEGSKILLFLGQNLKILARSLWGDGLSRKLFHEPYHISLHARHYVGPFMTFQGTCMVQKGSKICLSFGQIELLLQACYGVKTSAKPFDEP